MMPETILVAPPTVSTRDGRAMWTAAISHPSLPEAVWYSVPEQYADLLTSRLDPALVALTIPALHLGAQIQLDGVVTDELLHQHRELQSVYVTLGHGRAPVSVSAGSRAEAPKTRPEGVATGFSAGVDSFATLAENLYASDVPTGRRVTHLLYNNVGSHYGASAAAAGGPCSAEALPGQRQLWRTRLGQARPAADRIGLPIIDVDSNVAEVNVQRPGFQATHTPRNASVAHLLSHGIGTWLYASSYHYRDVGVRPGASKGSAVVDPITLPLMSHGALRAIPSGTHLRRVDKTALIADIEDAQKNLDVCVASEDGTNCTRCFKCLRTVATLDVLGKADLFRERFDLEVWQQKRARYFGQLLATRGHDPFAAEILELVAETGYQLPAEAQREALRIRAKDVARFAERRVKGAARYLVRR